jgi:hypothetical protein
MLGAWHNGPANGVAGGGSNATTTMADKVVMKGPSLSESGRAALHRPDAAITATAE